MSALYSLPYPILMTILGSIFIGVIVMLTWKRRVVLDGENGKTLYGLFCLGAVAIAAIIVYQTMKQFFPNVLNQLSVSSDMMLLMLLGVFLIALIGAIIKKKETRPLGIFIAVLLTGLVVSAYFSINH